MEKCSSDRFGLVALNDYLINLEPSKGELLRLSPVRREPEQGVHAVGGWEILSPAARGVV